MDLLVARSGTQISVAPDAEPGAAITMPIADFPDWAANREAGEPVRWVWSDTTEVYPVLLAGGRRLRTCHDLRLGHALLSRSAYAELSPGGSRWETTDPASTEPPSLLDELTSDADTNADLDELRDEHRRQRGAVAECARPGRLRLLLAAESVGALIAAEMRHDGLPWDVSLHDRQLTELLGPRPRYGGRPEKLEALAVLIRDRLDAPALNPDSPVELIRALQRAGIDVQTSRQSELERHDHPAIRSVVEYKKLARLWGANGWAWMDEWVSEGRFRPEYVPAGVVTGRWAARGGGALQLPKQIRAAVRADPGWRLVVADAAQLEPRILAAMAGDEQMAEASRRGDLYQALVDQGVVDTRAHAKVAMLGALYGATGGRSGQLMQRLTAAYPRAVGVVESAARSGERFEVVSTWLGRSSPLPSDSLLETQRRAAEAEADPADTQTARRQARDWGRFTRNFVVQGTAAEWALCWMAGLRRRLEDLSTLTPPELVYFLHDEIIVHAPESVAEQIAEAIRDAAAEAGRLLFGGFPVEFALDIAIVTGYDQA